MEIAHNIVDVVLVSLLQTLNKFHNGSISFIDLKHELLVWMSVCLEKCATCANSVIIILEMQL